MSSIWRRLLPHFSFFSSLWQSRLALSVAPEYLSSTAFKLVNPRGHVVATDSISQVFPASVTAGLSDEEALALFTSGFFGGFVFGLESLILRLVGPYLAPPRYPDFQPDPDAVSLWQRSAIPVGSLLPVGSSLFNSFRILDKNTTTTNNSADKTVSYVDYGFGYDGLAFAGCHRFQISREPDTEQVRIEMQHFRCNPVKNQLPVANYLKWFHYVYSRLLFANGIQSLLLR